LKLKKQEDRYARAYAEGLFSIDRFQEYLAPIREKLDSLERQMVSARAARNEQGAVPPFNSQEIEASADMAARALEHLNFEQKRTIVLNVIDKVVAIQEILKVYGHIPIADHVELCTNDRDGADAIKRRPALFRVRPHLPAPA
jgi:site-specific DNA recombinase